MAVMYLSVGPMARSFHLAYSYPVNGLLLLKAELYWLFKATCLDGPTN